MRGCSERTSVRATSMAWRTPFPPSRMPASIETSIKLVCVLADRAAGTDKSAVHVSMCAGTCLPQSRFSNTSIIGDCRAPKTGG